MWGQFWTCGPEGGECEVAAACSRNEALRSLRTVEGVAVFSRVEASELFGRRMRSVF